MAVVSIRRVLATVAAAAVVATTLISTPPAAQAAPAAPPGPEGPVTIEPFYAPIEPDGDAVRQDPRRRAAAPERRQPTAEDARRLAERLGATTYSGAGAGTAALAASGPRRPPGAPDEAYLDPCWNSDGGRGEYGRVYNRFEWCQRGRIGGRVLDEDGDEIGQFSFIFRAAAYGRDDGNRDVRVFLRSEPGTADYSAWPWDKATLRQSLMHLWAECDSFLDGCSAGGATAGKTVDDWDNDGSWHSWSVYSADAGEGPDRVERHLWHLRMALYSSGLPSTPAQKFAGSHTIRCDSAAAGFSRGRSKACVFDDVIPHLQYSAISPKHGEVARHIQCALDRACASYPLKDGKRVPGKFTHNPLDPGLHRITEHLPSHPDDVTYYAKNTYQKDQACRQGTPYLAAGLPPHLYNPPAQQCDEFPFASTKEGAGVGDWNFSVLGVTAADNRCAGLALKRFYRDDRVLVWRPALPSGAEDQFYVHITDAPDTSGPEACEDIDDPGGEPTDQPPTVSAGPDVSGDEGSVIALGGSATDAEGTPTAGWSYTPGAGTDPGASCSFTAPGSPATGITCTDDGTFLVTLSASDGVNGSVSDTATVTVRNVAPSPGVRPTLRAAAAPAGIASPRPWQLFRVGEPVTLTTEFTDPGLNDTHRCAADWDDGSADTFTARGRQCVREHRYTRAGMFTIGTGVTDDDGGVAEQRKVMVVVYDPAAGVPRGNGWLTAPGDGGFDVTASYPRLASTVPDGALTFALPPSAGLNLRNHQRLEWLVVTPDGKFAVKGTAERIPGQDVGFVLYGYYGCPAGTTTGCVPGPHRLRVVVWDAHAHGPIPEGVPAVYDNRAGSGFDIDVADPQPIASGTMQIQHPPIQ